MCSSIANSELNLILHVINLRIIRIASSNQLISQNYEIFYVYFEMSNGIITRVLIIIVKFYLIVLNWDLFLGLTFLEF